MKQIRMTYSHEKEAVKHRRTRKANSINAGSDRYRGKIFWCTDVRLVKHQLHKANRKDPDVVSSTYYKHRNYRLGTVCWART